MVIGYARVSTDDQDTAAQVAVLNAAPPAFAGVPHRPIQPRDESLVAVLSSCPRRALMDHRFGRGVPSSRMEQFALSDPAGQRDAQPFFYAIHPGAVEDLSARLSARR